MRAHGRIQEFALSSFEAPTHNDGTGPKYWEFFDDFNHGLDNNTTTGLGKWFFLETTGADTEIVDIANEYGVLKNTFTSVSEDVITMQGNSGLQVSSIYPNTPLVWSCRFQLSVANDMDFHIGYAIQDTSIEASEPANIACFRVVEGATTLQFRYGKGSSYGTQDVGILANTTWCRATFEFWPTVGNTDSGKLLYRIHSNGVDSGIKSAYITDKFPDGAIIFPTIQGQSGNATGGDYYLVDYVYGFAYRSAWVDGTG